MHGGEASSATNSRGWGGQIQRTRGGGANAAQRRAVAGLRRAQAAHRQAIATSRIQVESALSAIDEGVGQQLSGMTPSGAFFVLLSVCSQAIRSVDRAMVDFARVRWASGSEEAKMEGAAAAVADMRRDSDEELLRFRQRLCLVLARHAQSAHLPAVLRCLLFVGSRSLNERERQGDGGSGISPIVRLCSCLVQCAASLADPSRTISPLEAVMDLLQECGTDAGMLRAGLACIAPGMCQDRGRGAARDSVWSAVCLCIIAVIDAAAFVGDRDKRSGGAGVPAGARAADRGEGLVHSSHRNVSMRSIRGGSQPSSEGGNDAAGSSARQGHTSLHVPLGASGLSHALRVLHGVDSSGSSGGLVSPSADDDWGELASRYPELTSVGHKRFVWTRKERIWTFLGISGESAAGSANLGGVSGRGPSGGGRSAGARTRTSSASSRGSARQNRGRDRHSTGEDHESDDDDDEDEDSDPEEARDGFDDRFHFRRRLDGRLETTLKKLEKINRQSRKESESLETRRTQAESQLADESGRGHGRGGSSKRASSDEDGSAWDGLETKESDEELEAKAARAEAEADARAATDLLNDLESLDTSYGHTSASFDPLQWLRSGPCTLTSDQDRTRVAGVVAQTIEMDGASSSISGKSVRGGAVDMPVHLDTGHAIRRPGPWVAQSAI